MENDVMITDEGTTELAPRETLTATEARVLGVLIEKEACTPDHYPLSLNALVAGCNQRSNRDPVMHLIEREVILALDNLRDYGLAWSLSQAGSRVPKYRHSFTDRYAVSPIELAILGELMLRGPQTISELRMRAGRMTEMSTPEVEEAIRELEQHATGTLVGIAPRRPGQRGERYAHTLCGPMDEPEPDLTELAEPARRELTLEHARIDELESRITDMESTLRELTERFDSFAKQFE